MISVDTNVLIRWLANDDSIQSPIAKRLFSTEETFISLTVLLESEWVLKSLLLFDHEELNRRLFLLLSHEKIELEQSELVEQALNWHQVGLDFADALHLAQARGRFATFDKRLVNRTKKLGNTPEAYIPV
jgi:predicted nucleic-acid-binding protein